MPRKYVAPAAADACSATVRRSAAMPSHARWPTAARESSTTDSSATDWCVDNKPIAQVFADIADLLEIKGGNAFKIRAYRSAAETIAAYPDPIVRLDETQLRD